MHYSELTIQGRANWQYRGGARSALVPSRIQLHKFWQAYPRATLPLIPTMYDTWGSTSRILGVRGLWKKLSPLEGFGPPTDFQVSWRIWLGPTLPSYSLSLQRWPRPHQLEQWLEKQAGGEGGEKVEKNFLKSWSERRQPCQFFDLLFGF